MRDDILKKFWHGYLGIKANDFATPFFSSALDPQFLFKIDAKFLGCIRRNMEDVHMEYEHSLTAFVPTNLS